jgi:hypothetical protein
MQFIVVKHEADLEAIADIYAAGKMSRDDLYATMVVLDEQGVVHDNISGAVETIRVDILRRIVGQHTDRSVFDIRVLRSDALINVNPLIGVHIYDNIVSCIYAQTMPVYKMVRIIDREMKEASGRNTNLVKRRFRADLLHKLNVEGHRDHLFRDPPTDRFKQTMWRIPDPTFVLGP